MIPAILVIWIALSIAFAAGYVLRVLLEDADSGPDPSDTYPAWVEIQRRTADRRLKGLAPDYKSTEEPKEVDTPHPLNVPILLLALVPLVLMAACLPRIETVTVQECELAPLEARPSLPAVEYVERGSLLCLDTENQMKALERELRLRERVNYVEGAYQAVEERCGGGE